MSTFFFPSFTSCSLMIGATSSPKLRPPSSLGWSTVKCREHPGLISSRSCAAASWLTTLLSTWKQWRKISTIYVQILVTFRCNNVEYCACFGSFGYSSRNWCKVRPHHWATDSEGKPKINHVLAHAILLYISNEWAKQCVASLSLSTQSSFRIISCWILLQTFQPNQGHPT